MESVRCVVVVLAVACGPAVNGGAGSEEASGGEVSTTSSGSSSTGDATSSSSSSSSSSSTDADGCAQDMALQWSIERQEEDPRPVAAAPRDEGEFALIGHDGYGAPSEHTDAFIEVRDESGDVVWSRDYAGENDLNDEALSVAVGDDGSVYALIDETITFEPTGKSATVDGRMVVVRYTPDGLVDWRWVRERPPVKGYDSYAPEGLIEVVGDRLLVVEWARTGEPTNLLELDTSGNFVSEVELAPVNKNNFEAHAIASDGEVAVLEHVGDFGSLQIRARRFASDGALRWSKTFGSPDDRAVSVVAAGSGETYVAFADRIPDVETTIMLRRYDGDGTEAWTLPVLAAPPLPTDHDFAGSVAPDGTILLTGPRYVDLDAVRIPGNEPLWVMRIAPDGCVVSEFETDFPPPNSRGRGYAVVGTLGGGAVVLASWVSAENRESPWLGFID